MTNDTTQNKTYWNELLHMFFIKDTFYFVAFSYTLDHLQWTGDEFLTDCPDILPCGILFITSLLFLCNAKVTIFCIQSLLILWINIIRWISTFVDFVIIWIPQFPVSNELHIL